MIIHPSHHHLLLVWDQVAESAVSAEIPILTSQIPHSLFCFSGKHRGIFKLVGKHIVSSQCWVCVKDSPKMSDVSNTPWKSSKNHRVQMPYLLEFILFDVKEYLTLSPSQMFEILTLSLRVSPFFQSLTIASHYRLVLVHTVDQLANWLLAIYVCFLFIIIFMVTTATTRVLRKSHPSLELCHWSCLASSSVVDEVVLWWDYKV